MDANLGTNIIIRFGSKLNQVINVVSFSHHVQSAYALVYAIFINSALCYLLMTWSNLHLSSILVTAFWPVQVTAAMPLTFTYVAIFSLIAGLLLAIQY